MKLKCLFVLLLLGMFTLRADDDCAVGFWFDAPSGIGGRSIEGVSFGIPISATRSVEGAELSLIGSASKTLYGFQFAWIGFNSADTMTGCQLAFVNLVNSSMKDVGVQLGFINHSARKGFQLGFLNNCSDNASFQLGLLNINKNGLLPFMIFINFGSDVFK